MLADVVNRFYQEIKLNLIGNANTSVGCNFVALSIAVSKSLATIHGEVVLIDGLLLFQSWSWGPH